MKTSLKSAASLLALLLLEHGNAAADPIVTIGKSAPSFYVLGNTWEAGSDTPEPPGAANGYQFTPLTTGVISVSSLYGGSNPYWQDQSAFMDLTAASVDMTPETGYRAPAESVGNSVFVGTSGGQLLLDSSSGMPAAASASYGYTFSPKDGSAANDLPDDADIPDKAEPALPPLTGDDATATGIPTVTIANAAKPEQPSAPGPAPRYTYNPLRPAPSGTNADLPERKTTFRNKPPQNKRIKPSGDTALAAEVPAASPLDLSAGARSGPDIAPGESVFTTRPPPSASPDSGHQDHEDPVVNQFWKIVRDSRGGNALNPGYGDYTDLTAKGYPIADLESSSFTVAPFSHGKNSNNDVTLPIVVLSTGFGELPSSLMIFSTASAQVDGADIAFTYFFDGAVLQ